ncbi:MAG: ParA family protein [Reichenbachiella sp.]
MSKKVGIISQKGGVGKSTMARGLAREYAKSEWQVLIADLDTSQSTSFEWNSRRMSNDVDPFISVQQFPSVDRVMKIADNYDLILFDGAPHATRASEQIAKECDLVLLPTGCSKDDLDPQIRLGHELVKKGIERSKIQFVLCRVGNSDVEIEETVDYISVSGYKVIKGSVPEKGGYRRAMDEGKTITETSYKSLNNRADEVIESIVKILS